MKPETTNQQSAIKDEGRLHYEYAVEQGQLGYFEYLIGRHLKYGWGQLALAAGDFSSLGARFVSSFGTVGSSLRHEVTSLFQEICNLPSVTKEMWKNGDFFLPFYNYHSFAEAYQLIKHDFRGEMDQSLRNFRIVYHSRWNRTCKAYVAGVIFLSMFTLYHYKINPWPKHDINTEIPCLHKTVVITGATSGIGFRLAYEFAKRGAFVVITSPEMVKARKARLDLSRKLKKYIYKRKKLSIKETGVRYYDQLVVAHKYDIVFLLQNIVEVELNLACTASIYSFTRKLQGMSPDGIDILINNAAVKVPPEEMVVTNQGKEVHFAVNYFGHFTLTNLLIGLLAKRKGARIINVACKEAVQSGYIKMNEFIGTYLEEEGLPFLPAKNGYANSKLAMYLFNRQLAKELQLSGVNNITTYCVCPGTTNTNLNRYMKLPSFEDRYWNYYASSFHKKDWHAVQPILHCALSHECSHESGFFYENNKKVYVRTSHRNPDEVAQALWNSSITLMTVGHNPMLKLTEQMHILSHENVFQLASTLFLHRRDVMTHLLLMEEKQVFKTRHRKHVDERGDARESFTYFWNSFYLSGGENSGVIERWVLHNTHPGFRELQKEYDIWFECTGTSHYHPKADGKMATLQYMDSIPNPLLQDDIEELEKLYESDPEPDERIENNQRHYPDYISMDEFIG